VTYTYRYLNSVGSVLHTSVVDCESDTEAVTMASRHMQAHYTTLEVWRGELVYRGSGAGKTMLTALKLESYRNKAEELRIIAEDYKVKETRESLLRLATEYDSLAERFGQDVSAEGSDPG